MYLFLIVGHTGQGKTTFVKDFVNGKNQYIFDINNEYDLPTDTAIFPQMRHVQMDVKKYVEVVQKLKNTNIVFEDATGFLRGRQSAEFMRLIVAKRHTGNNFLLLFHSVNRIPPELMEMANFVVLFKTVDNIDSMKKFNNATLTANFTELQTMPKFSKKIIKLI